MGGDKENRRDWCGRRQRRATVRVYFTCGEKEATPLGFPIADKNYPQDIKLFT